MKKIICLLLTVICIFSVTGCNERTSEDTALKGMESNYQTIIETNSTAKIRECLSNLKNFMNDGNLTENEKKLAKVTYLFCDGIARLSMTSKGVSVFDFRDISVLKESIEYIFESEDYSYVDKMIPQYEDFSSRVLKLIED